MIDDHLFRGQRVRLAMDDSQALAEAHARWSHDTLYWRLQASDPSRPFSKRLTREWFEKRLLQAQPDAVIFSIHTLEDDRLIGEVELDGIDWLNGDAYVGIGIGESDFWGKGYGTEAMQLVLRYAFQELNLHRLTLNVFEYNPRAIRSYEKAGFVYEGRVRKFLRRDGQEWDMVHMGILRQEWLAREAGA